MKPFDNFCVQSLIRLAIRMAWAALCIALVVVSSIKADAASVSRYWELSPYRVRASVTIQTSAVVKSRLEAELPRFLQQRAEVAYGPLWNLTLDKNPLGTPLGKVELKDDRLLQISAEEMADTRRHFDKLIVVVIKESPLGFHVSAQQYDCLLEAWSPIVNETTTHLLGTPELCFSTMQQAFTPMAKFSVIRESLDHVELSFRGSELPQVPEAARGGLPGQVLKPVLRRTDREGNPVEEGIQPVSWTYLQVDPVEGKQLTATIQSHTRQPFGVRRRGRVDQLASVVRISKAPTRLRLHSREEKDLPLGGFLVYQRNSGEKKGVQVGKTDRNGMIIIPPGKTPIQIALVQSSGRWIAKVPLVPGADVLVEAPLLDDRKRLEAEAKLTAIREELIDVVARRSILATRIRIKIKKHDLEEASKLIKIIEKLPTASGFESKHIRNTQSRIKSKNQLVQKHINTLFDNTRAVLAEFLSPGLIQELKNEIREARQNPPKVDLSKKEPPAAPKESAE